MQYNWKPLFEDFFKDIDSSDIEQSETVQQPVKDKYEWCSSHWQRVIYLYLDKDSKQSQNIERFCIYLRYILDSSNLFTEFSQIVYATPETKNHRELFLNPDEVYESDLAIERRYIVRVSVNYDIEKILRLRYILQKIEQLAKAHGFRDCHKFICQKIGGIRYAFMFMRDVADINKNSKTMIYPNKSLLQLLYSFDDDKRIEIAEEFFDSFPDNEKMFEHDTYARVMRWANDPVNVNYSGTKPYPAVKHSDSFYKSKVNMDSLMKYANYAYIVNMSNVNKTPVQQWSYQGCGYFYTHLEEIYKGQVITPKQIWIVQYDNYESMICFVKIGWQFIYDTVSVPPMDVTLIYQNRCCKDNQYTSYESEWKTFLKETFNLSDRKVNTIWANKKKSNFELDESYICEQNNSQTGDDYTQKLFKEAKERFGITYNLKEAGYVLPDGSMLDFSGRHQASPKDWDMLRGQRCIDHRDISELNYERDMNTRSQFSTDMYDFISRGAIRIDIQGGVMNMMTQPTQKQKEILRKIITYNEGEVTLDIGDENENYVYVDYDSGTKYQRVFADIDRWFNEHIKPVTD